MSQILHQRRPRLTMEQRFLGLEGKEDIEKIGSGSVDIFSLDYHICGLQMVLLLLELFIIHS